MMVLKAWRIKKRFILLAAAVFIILVCCVKLISLEVDKRSISALSWAMANKMVVVDPGHGGADPGAVGSGGGVEKEITLAVSMKLAEFLRQSGASVLLTRESDKMLCDPGATGFMGRKRQDLTRRVNMANENNADAFISVHVNSFVADRRQHGAQTFSQPGSEESKELSKCIQAELIRLLKNTNRKPKQVDYFTNRKTNMPSVIVEIGFVSNPGEEKMMLDPVYQTKIAFSIYAGLVKYFAEKDTGGDLKNIPETNKKIT